MKVGNEAATVADSEEEELSSAAQAPLARAAAAHAIVAWLNFIVTVNYQCLDVVGDVATTIKRQGAVY